MKPLFYLLSLKISGIKNIEVPIELNFYKKTINNSDFDPEKYRIKAIYGENGSGKTAIISRGCFYSGQGTFSTAL